MGYRRAWGDEKDAEKQARQKKGRAAPFSATWRTQVPNIRRCQHRNLPIPFAFAATQATYHTRNRLSTASTRHNSVIRILAVEELLAESFVSGNRFTDDHVRVDSAAKILDNDVSCFFQFLVDFEEVADFAQRVRRQLRDVGR